MLIKSYYKNFNTGGIIILKYVCVKSSNFLRGFLNTETIKRVLVFQLSIWSTTAIWLQQTFDVLDVKLLLGMCITVCVEFCRKMEYSIRLENLYK